MASPGGPMTAPMAPIHPQYIPFEVLRPWGYSDGSTAAVIYQTSRCNGKFVHHRTSPACRGLGAVDNVTSIETGGYGSKMWYRTDSLQRRESIGDIHTSFWPVFWTGLLSGASAAPLSVDLPDEFGFADETTPLPG